MIHSRTYFQCLVKVSVKMIEPFEFVKGMLNEILENLSEEDKEKAVNMGRKNTKNSMSNRGEQ